jgi:pimeloyl-ACP methyl ester carboxylesterase
LNLASRFFSRRTLFADRFLYATPAALGLEAREVEFPAAAGVTLRGWFLPGAKPGAIVFCAGNSGNVSFHLEYVRAAARAGHAVLAFDYRGFGRSGGEPDLRYLARDVLAAAECAAGAAACGPVGLFGLSTGAVAALEAACRAGGKIAGVAAEGVSDIAWMLEGLLHEGRFGPLRYREIEAPGGETAAREPARIGRGVLPRVFSRLAARAASACYPGEAGSLASMARRLASIPVLLIHGVEDGLLPFEAAIDLHAALRGPKRLWLIPGAGHAQEPVLCAHREYPCQLENFFAEAFALAGAGGNGGATVFPGRSPPLPRPASGPARPAAALWTVASGTRLRQSIVGAGKQAVIAAGDSLDVSWPLDLHAPGEDPVAARFRKGGYQELFRRLARAVNERDAAALDAGLDAHLSLAREYPFDFLAAGYALRAARAALGLAPGWRLQDRGLARRSLERFLLLWRAHPFLPQEDAAASPAAWARRALDECSA